MKTLTLLLEMRCNNFCFFCGNRAIDAPMIRTRERLGLSIPKADRSLDYGALPTAKSDLEEKRYTLPSALEELRNAAQDGYTSLSLQGGEPSLWPWVVELCREADALGFKEIQMVTNGQRFADREFCEQIIAAKLSALVFSVLGKDAETHDGQTLVPGSFDKIIAGIENCVEVAEQLDSPIKITATIVVSKRTYEQLPEIIDLLAASGLRGASLHLIRFDLFGDDPKVREWMSFAIEDAVPAIEEAHRRAQQQAFTLHVDSLPICLFPTIRSFDLKAWHRRHISQNHKFAAASFGYTHDKKSSFWERQLLPIKDLAARVAAPSPTEQGDAGRRRDGIPQPGAAKAGQAAEKRTFEPCRSCLLNQGCARVPMDHIDPSRPTPLSPVSLQSFLDDLERIPERVADSDNRLHDWTNTLETLRESSIFTDSEQRLLQSSFRKACTEAFNHAVKEGDLTQARKLFYRVQGQQPPTTLSANSEQQTSDELELNVQRMQGQLRVVQLARDLKRASPLSDWTFEGVQSTSAVGVLVTFSQDNDSLGVKLEARPNQKQSIQVSFELPDGMSRERLEPVVGAISEVLRNSDNRPSTDVDSSA